MTINDVEKMAPAFNKKWLANAILLTTRDGLAIKIKKKSNLSLDQIENLKSELKKLNLEFKPE